MNIQQFNFKCIYYTVQLSLIDLFLTGGNRINAFKIPRNICKIRTSVNVCERPLTCHLCTWRAHNLSITLNKLRNTVKTISYMYIFLCGNINLTAGIPDI